MEPESHMKGDVFNRSMKGFVLVMLNIRKDLIASAWMFGVVHSQDMQNHPIYYVFLDIGFRVEVNKFG